MTGKQVRLFLVEGTTGSLMTAEIMNWTGHLIAAPRTELNDLLSRSEVVGTGVYLLIGDDDSGKFDSKVYIGEGDAVDIRLRAHARPQDAGGKDFWNRVVVITSKDANITKAHARYLESRLISLATSARRSLIENAQSPGTQNLPEADQSDMEYFIAQLSIILPVLGVQLLRSTHAPLPSRAATERRSVELPDEPPIIARSNVTGQSVALNANESDAPMFRMKLSKTVGQFAFASEIDSEFVVKESSVASLVAVNSMPAGYKAKRQQLIDNGSLVANGPVMELTVDDVAASVSEAASVMNGGSENGRKRWQTVDGTMTYGEWQDSQSVGYIA